MKKSRSGRESIKKKKEEYRGRKLKQMKRGKHKGRNV